MEKEGLLHHGAMVKRSLTLLEVVIAFVLLGFLLATLIPTYILARKQQSYFEKGKDEMFQRLKFHYRLQQLIRLSWPKAEGNTLIFTYDNSIDPDPLFRVGLTSTLSIEGKDIKLLTTPKKGDWRKEVIWENATLSFMIREDKYPLLITVNDTPFWFKKE